MADSLHVPTRLKGAAAQRHAAADQAITRWIRLGLLVIIATLGVSILWSTLAPLSSAVVASGVVKVDTSRKRIQHLEGGIVKEILVRDGARVKAGDVLVRLDETRAGATHGVLQSASDSSLAQQARLVAERDRLNDIPFPQDMLDRQSTDPKVGEYIATQRALFKARRESLAGQLSILGQQIGSLNEEIKGLSAQQKSKEEQLASVRAEFESLQDLLAVGMVEKTKVRSLEREMSRLQGERAEHASRIAAARSAIAEKELQQFQLRKTFQEEVVAELKKVQGELFDYAERESAARQTLQQTEIRSPVDGTVVDLKVHTIGGVISPGEPLLELVPDGDRLIIEARVLPQDIDRVMRSMPAGVKLSAFDQRTLPELEGSVTYVSADAIDDPRLQMQFFLMRVEVPDRELVRLEGRQIQPGMMAEVFVRTGERTFFGYLLQPLVSSFNRAWRER